MKHFSLLPALLGAAAIGALWLPFGASAQQPEVSPARPVGVPLDLKDGSQVLATGFRLADNVLLATQPVGNGTGEIGYPLANVERVEFPDPPQLETARGELAQWKDNDALAHITPIVSYYAPFRNIPGNWWLPAALVKLDALAGLRRDGEFDALLAELGRMTNLPAAQEAFQLRTAESLAWHNHPDKAEPIFDALIKTSTDDATLARAWIGKGSALLGRRDPDAALLAYLHVPVFYPDERRQMAPALLGSGKAFSRLDQSEPAQDAFRQIVAGYASAPEAKEADAELRRLNLGKPNS